MRKLAAALTAVGILCACTAHGASSEERQTLLILPDEQSARKHMAFLVDSSKNGVYRRAAETFAGKVEELSGGLLTVEVSSSVEAVSDFTAGKAQFVYLDAKRDTDLSPDFATLAAPLRYKDQKTYTMALNSPRMAETLNDRLESRNILLLGAFYQGTNYFVSDEATTGGGFETDQEDEMERLSAVVYGDSGVAGVLAAYGMEVHMDRSFPGRLQMLLERTANLAEFSPEELVSVDWSSGYYLYTTNHSITPGWLAVDRRMFDGLPTSYQAVIREACAYLYPVIDKYYAGLESSAALRLHGQGVVTSKSFDGLREAAARMEAQSDVPDHRKKYLIDLIQGLA